MLLKLEKQGLFLEDLENGFEFGTKWTGERVLQEVQSKFPNVFDYLKHASVSHNETDLPLFMLASKHYRGLLMVDSLSPTGREIHTIAKPSKGGLSEWRLYLGKKNLLIFTASDIASYQ